MPMVDCHLALKLKGITSALRKALSQEVGAKGSAHLANHTCFVHHHNAKLESFTVAPLDREEDCHPGAEVVAIPRAAKRF